VEDTKASLFLVTKLGSLTCYVESIMMFKECAIILITTGLSLRINDYLQRMRPYIGYDRLQCIELTLACRRCCHLPRLPVTIGLLLEQVSRISVYDMM